MKSDSAPSLRQEDRPDFERALTEALRSAYSGLDDEPALGVDQLRAMALSAVEPIVACAGSEYRRYLEERGQADPGSARPVSPAEQSASGAGLFAVVAVLTPILAGTAALIFLVLGYVLHALETPEPTIAAPLRTAGWLFGAIAALGILAGMIGLVATALHNGSRAIRDRDLLPPEVAAARDIWLDALVQRGIRPFLDEALDQATASPGPTYDDEDGHDGRNGHAGYDASGSHGTHDTRGGRDGARSHSADASRMPRLGYSRPDFSSPAADDEPTDPGPRFSSPRFTGPHFGKPENEAR